VSIRISASPPRPFPTRWRDQENWDRDLEDPLVGAGLETACLDAWRTRISSSFESRYPRPALSPADAAIGKIGTAIWKTRW
jgi:hypothetical protein